MTPRSTTTDAAATLWGVGSYHDGNRRVAWEISQEEIQRDMGAAAKTLAGIGVGAGDKVLFCSMLSETGQFWPLIVGSMLSGAQLSCADASEGDAIRVAMFTRLMPYRAVLGVTPEILDGFDRLGRSYAEVFAGVDVVGARPGAYERLLAVGLTPQWFLLCGPAVAIAPEPGEAARADATEWELASEEGRVVVTALRERAMRFDRAPTGVRGEVVDGGVMPQGA